MVDGQGVRHSTERWRGDLEAARDLADYQRLLRGVIGELLKSDAKAMKIAMDTWSYGVDPQVETADLWEARHVLDAVRLRLAQGDAREQVVWDLAGGALEFTLAYLGQSSACRLQHDWSAQVLNEVQGVDDPGQRHERLFGQQGVIPAFLNGPLKAFIERDARHYRAREALGQPIALQAPFLAFISGMQKTRAAMEQRVRDSKAADQAREYQRRELEAEETLLQAELADLQPRLLLLRAITATVDLSVTPVQLNPGARQLPRRTRLTLQCSGRTTTLENFNFPTQASFAWAPQVCGDVDLKVDFEYFSLHKRWLGERGFIAFLRTFSVGRFTFTPEDFPNQRDLLEGAGIEWLQLTYRQQGEQELLSHYAEVERLENRVSDASLRLRSLRERMALQLRAQGSAAVRSRAVTASPTLIVPTRIADCWNGSRGTVVQQSDVAEDEVG